MNLKKLGNIEWNGCSRKCSSVKIINEGASNKCQKVVTFSKICKRAPTIRYRKVPIIIYYNSLFNKTRKTKQIFNTRHKSDRRFLIKKPMYHDVSGEFLDGWWAQLSPYIINYATRKTSDVQAPPPFDVGSLWFNPSLLTYLL